MKRWIALALVLVMAFSLVACGSGSSTSQPAASGGGEGEENLPVLKVAVMPFLNTLPIVYMIDNGLDVANGFKIETVYFANGTAMNEALAADQWEVGTLSAACTPWSRRIPPLPPLKAPTPPTPTCTVTRTACAAP